MNTDFRIHDDVLDREMSKGNFVVAVVTATKPDFYKQAPLVPAADERDLPCFVLHTGQHYDDLLGHGLKEYGIEDRVGADLGIRGGLSQKTAELHTKIKKFTDHIEEEYGEKTVLPVVHGDTLAAGIVPQAWMFATNTMAAHNEAGLRGMAPRGGFDTSLSPHEFLESQWESDWDVVRNEPFPEQYDTFVGSAASIYHFAPTHINREHLINEGYPEAVRGDRRIEVVGNSVIDAIEMKRDNDLEESVFDVYPELERRDDWIRVDIHRRANLLPDRFKSIVGGVINLVEHGYNVNFVELTATKKALQNYGMRDRLERLDEDHDNFLFTGLWKKHAHVYEFLESGKCFAELTDSGSMQEELNHIEETICLTARYNTDRPETVFEAGTNALVPPESDDLIHGLVDHIYTDENTRERISSGPKIYGENVAGKITDFLDRKRQYDTFEWAHERLGSDGEESKGFDYL